MRPATLSEAVERTMTDLRSDAQSEFLDAFYLETQSERRIAMLRDEPAFTGSRQIDAWYGGVAEYLTKRYRLGNPPDWCSNPWRTLPEPWHTIVEPTPGLIEYLSFVSPAEFKHRNIYTEAAPLRRATQSRT